MHRCLFRADVLWTPGGWLLMCAGSACVSGCGEHCVLWRVAYVLWYWCICIGVRVLGERCVRLWECGLSIRELCVLLGSCRLGESHGLM